MCVNIVILGIPSSEECYRSQLLSDRITDVSISAHVSLRVQGSSFIDPVRKQFMFPSQQEGASLPNPAVKSCRTSSMLLPEFTRSFPCTCKQRLFQTVEARVSYLKLKKRIYIGVARLSDYLVLSLNMADRGTIYTPFYPQIKNSSTLN